LSATPESNAGFTATERMHRVLELLETRDTVTVAELARTFAVSEVTVRNDLGILARQGAVARTRGGARALQQGQSEVAFDVRLRVSEHEKRAIGRAAAAMVGDGEAVALDSSTTAYYLALELRQKKELVVVTNGLRIAEALADAPGVSVIMPGGVLRLPAMSLVGHFATGVLESTNIATGFFGARGISVGRGLTDLNPEEVDLKRMMADACERVIGIFDHTKWHRNALLTFAPTSRIDGIVTDALAPAQLVGQWRERDVEVVTAEIAAVPALLLEEVRPTTRRS
jgi:DeoR/GlpR family transcriptional regulator of sugar metabolism